MNSLFTCIARGREVSETLQYRCMHGPPAILEDGGGYGDSELGRGNGGGTSHGSAARAYMSSKGSWFLLFCVDTADLGTSVVNAVCRMQP